MIRRVHIECVGMRSDPDDYVLCAWCSDVTDHWYLATTALGDFKTFVCVKCDDIYIKRNVLNHLRAIRTDLL